MVFSSITFLFYFLPLVVLLYFVTPRALKNNLLLAASLLFYLWGGGAFILLLLIAIGANYGFGFLVHYARQKERRGWLAGGVAGSCVVSLSLLGYYKYANFFVEQINSMGAALGWQEIAWVNIGLPIGISFYIFQSMSYVFDIARGVSRPLRNPLDFALYVALFPQLIAGPIVRFQDIEAQIRSRSVRLEDFTEGTLRFCWGLIKKVVIADGAAQVAVAAFATPGAELTTAAAWLGALAYTVQIYFDFSGYSDMAIGLGRLFGFRFPENFNRPYSALSITDFWRRWHITLSTWFRDYLYITLGGSRRGTLVTFRNLWIVFLVTGLWHGANWTFILWGVYHGLLLALERVLGRNYTREAPRPALQRAVTFFLVLIGWVIFRAESLDTALAYYRAMFSLRGLDLAVLQPHLAPENLLVVALGLLTALYPGTFSGSRWLLGSMTRQATLARYAVLALVLPYCLVLVISGSFSPFLYFQF